MVSFSSGNHAQALALVGKLLHTPTVIVMPDDAPAVKLAATRGYGAEVVLYDRVEQKREVIARQLGEERGLTLIPPFEHPHIIAGQGTAALELLTDVPDLDVLIVPIGGGGLISGCSIAAHALKPEIRASSASNRTRRMIRSCRCKRARSWRRRNRIRSWMACCPPRRAN